MLLRSQPDKKEHGVIEFWVEPSKFADAPAAPAAPYTLTLNAKIGGKELHSKCVLVCSVRVSNSFSLSQAL
jgi:hypothetical protein